jgi:hypothetical protein
MAGGCVMSAAEIDNENKKKMADDKKVIFSMSKLSKTTKHRNKH